MSRQRRKTTRSQRLTRNESNVKIVPLRLYRHPIVFFLGNYLTHPLEGKGCIPGPSLMDIKHCHVGP